MEAAESLNQDLSKMMDWANQWLVKFSPPKTVTLNITKKKKKLDKPSLFMDNTILKNVSSHKHLGVTLTEDLSWSDHIENMAVGANRALDIFNALKFKLDRKSLEKFYFSYIRPKLEYSSIVWDNCPQYLLDLLEKVQIRAAKIISGAISRTSHALIYAELCWETLEERRKKQRLCTMYKVMHNLSPVYLTQTIPQVNAIADYNLRNADALPGFNARTTAFQHSFFPQTISDWNKLESEVRNAASLQLFKSKISKDTKKHPPDWYYHGERRLSLLHARMRMLCSPLNDHLHSHIHVLDSPQCPCGHARETSKHFLMDCPLYAIEREALIDTLEGGNFPFTIQNLLFGSPKQSPESNRRAFEAVQNFIKNTTRFD